MKPVLNFDYEDNKWKLKTPFILNKAQLHNLVKYSSGVYKKRISGEIGERRKRMAFAFGLLNENNIHQYLIADGNDKIIYEDLR